MIMMIPDCYFENKEVKAEHTSSPPKKGRFDVMGQTLSIESYEFHILVQISLS